MMTIAIGVWMIASIAKGVVVEIGIGFRLGFWLSKCKTEKSENYDLANKKIFVLKLCIIIANNHQGNCKYFIC